MESIDNPNQPTTEDIRAVVEDLSQTDTKTERNDRAGAAIPYDSPVLRLLSSTGRAIPDTACRLCPKALWRTTKHHLVCYCRLMFVETYSDERPGHSNLITHCDGPLLGEDEP